MNDIRHTDQWLDNMFALEDSFISLYDIVLETGEYHRYSKSVVPCLVNTGDFTSDLPQNAELLVFPEDREGLIGALSPARMRRKLDENGSLEHYCRNMVSGNPEWVKVRGVYKDGGRENVILGIFRVCDEDTKDEHTRLSMLETARVFSDAFLNSYLAAYYVNISDFTYGYVNCDSTLTKRVGRSDNFLQFVGRYAERWVHPDDRPLLLESIRPEYIRARMKEGKTFSINVRDMLEGRERWLRVDLARGADDDHVGVALSDVTDQVEREQDEEYARQQRHLQLFGDMINAALWSFDIRGRHEITSVSWSDQFRQMLGYCGRDEFPDTIESWTDRLHPSDRMLVLEYFWDRVKLQPDRFEHDIKFRLLRKSGKYCWFRSIGRMEEIEGGGRRMFGIIIDLTSEMKLKEQKVQLEEALSMARSASRAKTVFLNNMSHDIRTPMNAIIGYTSLALTHLEDKRLVKDYLGKIGQSSNHLLSLINDVLDMSRIESGKMNLEDKEENLTEIIRDMRNMVQADIRAKRHKFSIEFVNVENENIYCDRLRLNQVLLNILSNAVKYTPDGGNISMRITQKTARHFGYATYEFRVKDNGIGIDPEFMKVVFEPFTRMKSSTVSGIQGTGLGMAITKNIIDIVGGTIDVESEPGKGTEVIMSFEFKLAGANEVKEIQIEEHMTDLNGVKVLLVEDNKINREIAVTFLEEIGCRVVDFAEDGTIAVEKVKAASYGDFDVILMDIQMPVMNGYEATRHIRALGTDISRVPIIAMTANAFEEDRRAALDAGMDEHVAKPIDLARLKSVLAGFLL